MRRAMKRSGAIGRLVAVSALFLLLLLLPLPGARPQQACLADQEPNDSPETAQAVAGEFCLDGSISDTDQEILAWKVEADAARRPWTISLKGPAGLQSRLQLHLLEEPGDGTNPAVVGPELFALVTPAGADSVERQNVYLTGGVWLIGISVSAGDGGAYHLGFAAGEAPPPPATANDTAQTATQVAGAFAVQGQLARRQSWFQWKLSALDSRKRWNLVATAPLGAEVGLEVLAPDGRPLLGSTRLTEGRLELPDIGLPAGTYGIRLADMPPAAHPFSLSTLSSGPRSPGREEEPNDAPLTARPLALGQATKGRISQPGDIDTYVLPAPAQDGQLLAIQIGGASQAITRLCIGGADGAFLHCREGVAPMLSDIAQTPAARFVTVSGGANPQAGYELTARVSGVASGDTEAEPNDTTAQANPLAMPAMRGRLAGDDTDMFRFAVDTAALLNFSVVGDEVLSAEITDGSGQSSARTDRAMDAEGKPASGPLELRNLTLAPGPYVLALSGKGGAYTIERETAAPPAVNPNLADEREPNDAVEQALLLAEGSRVAATLSQNDADMFRISLRSHGGIALHVDVDGSCTLAVELTWYSAAGATPILKPQGKGFVYEALLEAGDYDVAVRPDMSCTEEARYRIGYDAAPDLPEVGDVEPNNAFATARPLPDSLQMAGVVGQFGDEDWLLLPKVDADTEVTLAATGNVELSLTDGKSASSFMMSAPTEIAYGAAGQPFSGVVPAGRAGAVRIMGSGPYTLQVSLAGAPAGKPAAAAAEATVSMQLALEAAEVAAYWHRGQRLAGTLTVTNKAAEPAELELSASAPTGWRLELPDRVSVAANSSETGPVSLEIEPDAFATRAARVGIDAEIAGAPAGSAFADIAVSVAAAPVGDHLAFRLPVALLGGFNVAWTGLGGTLLPSDQITPEEGPETINDGLGSNAGFMVDAAKLPLALTIQFGGDRAWPTRGIAINPQTPGLFPAEYLGDFELLLSADGHAFEPALTGRVTLEAREQAFVLPEAVNAKAAQLRMLSNHDGNLGRAGFSEWKVIADPTASIGASLDLADIGRGGHIVWSQPLISDQTTVIKSVLEAGGDGPLVPVPAGLKPQFTVGFNEDRAAQIVDIEWTDSALAPEASLFPGVLVEASTETPLGPWTSLGTWALERDAEGRARRVFDTPVWARFLRFTATDAPQADGAKVQFPTGLRIGERIADANYRSVIGEWSQYSPVGFYEMTQPPAPATRDIRSANNSRETAEPLAIDEIVSGRVEIGTDEDWYRLVQPEGLDLLAISLTGEPTVAAEVLLREENGKAVPLSETGGTPRLAEYEARVEPGRTYFLQVSQPPHSVTIAYDTSGSLLQFIPIIYNALEVFAGGVTPGHEAVNFMPFDRPALLRDFSDQPAILKQALARDARESTTSGLEGTAIAAMRDLSTRRGTRALLLVTDAASSTTGAFTDMWTMVEQARPRIFAAHTGSFDDPLREKQVLQDLALASGGNYVSARSQPELDVAFDRVAAWLRRPASYTLKVAARKAAPPQPGAIMVTGNAITAANSEAYAAAPDGGSAIEIVLDASGSMLKRMEGRRRIEIARTSLGKLIREELKPDDPVAIRVFGNDRPGSCETSLMQPLGPLDPDSAVALVDAVEPQNLAKTPIAASLSQIAEDLAGASGRKTVILLTDGEETCGGDPRAEIAKLAENDIEVRVNIVGFAVDDPALKGEFREWARIGRGRYFDAGNPAELDQAVKAATELPFKVSDGSGALVAEGVVGGEPVPLPAGTYRVEIASTPPRIVEAATVRENETTRLDAGGI